MNEEEFLKEHPSAKGMILSFVSKNEFDKQLVHDMKFMNLESIDKTQLDKAKVTEIIDKLKDTKWDIELTPEEYHVNYNKLKKELGLK